MITKLIKNDIRKSKMITAAILVFVLVAAMLTSLASSLIISMFGAIDNMLAEAKTPHYMQMHTGEVDAELIKSFADAHESVDAWQVREFVNIDGAEIIIGADTLAWSVQDNGFSTQSNEFDYLLDLSGKIVCPAAGEIYIPIYYMTENAARIGDTVRIGEAAFTVAGFIRDSLMNAPLVSSKRFLVSEIDYEKIREAGVMEYLIEFRFTDSSLPPGFEMEYLQEGLPANGPPAIVYSQVRIMNALADGIMIAVLVLISLLVIAVTFLCIRFTLLAKVEEDYREIGVLKAVGLRVSDIKKLYIAKYGAICGIASAIGFVFSIFIREPFMENIRLYLGESGSRIPDLLFGLLGAAAIYLVVMMYVNGVLRLFKKISAAQALRFGAPQEKSKHIKGFSLSRSRLLSGNLFLGIKDVMSRKKLYITMLLVLVISSFIMNVPQNIYNTISDKSFMTYMGMGECDAILGTSRTLTDNVEEKTDEMARIISADADVLRYTVLKTYMYDMVTNNGSAERLRVELGDHSVFPIMYSKGRAPEAGSEISISTLYSEELGKTLGDEIILISDGSEKSLTVTGIYSDVTNGGRTAKAVFKANRQELLWSSIPVLFKGGVPAAEKITEYREMFHSAKISGVEENIQQMLGSAISVVRIASIASKIAAVLLTILVTLLFLRMLVTKDRYPIAILKSTGFTNLDIKKQYICRAVMVFVLAVIIGTVLSNTAGELVGIALIYSFGATTFDFVVNPLFSYVLSPLLIALGVFAASQLGTTDIKNIKIAEYIKEA